MSLPSQHLGRVESDRNYPLPTTTQPPEIVLLLIVTIFGILDEFERELKFANMNVKCGFGFYCCGDLCNWYNVLSTPSPVPHSPIVNSHIGLSEQLILRYLFDAICNGVSCGCKNNDEKFCGNEYDCTCCLLLSTPIVFCLIGIDIRLWANVVFECVFNVIRNGIGLIVGKNNNEINNKTFGIIMMYYYRVHQ